MWITRIVQMNGTIFVPELLVLKNLLTFVLAEVFCLVLIILGNIN